MWFLRALLGVVVALVLLFVIFLVVTWKSAIDPIAAPVASSFDGDQVAKGAQLAAVGNCIACHTRPGGAAFAGGLPVPTPFGTIYSVNITPDPDTGIGHWSEAAFRRAMREGVDAGGHYLYPAFPYDHFTLVTDADNQALYAYLMTRQPVQAKAPANELAFPYNVRMGLALWNALYLHKGPYQSVAGKPDEWNRGAYLVEGLGHCGACHTPRNRLGAEERDAQLSGGEAEGWTAYPINAASPAPVPWTPDALAFYLRNGWHGDHGVSRGPMAEVTGNLAGLPDADIQAIAVYVADRMGQPDQQRQQAGEAALQAAAAHTQPGASADTQTLPGQPGDERGQAIYATACASCHEAGRPLPYGGLSFHLSTAVHADNPQNIVNVVLYGLPPADGQASAVMPAYRGILSDADMVALLNYLRGTFSDKPAWTGLDQMVADTRSGAHRVTIRPADGIERAPGNVAAEDTGWQRISR